LGRFETWYFMASRLHALQVCYVVALLDVQLRLSGLHVVSFASLGSQPANRVGTAVGANTLPVNA